MDAGHLKLLVNGARESGESVRLMWLAPVRHFGFDRMERPKRLLMLGIGGGTVLDMFLEYYPGLRADAVDIDPVIIGIARQHFGIGRSGNVTLVESDADAYIRKRTVRGPTYDIILVDLFIGNRIPDFVLDQRFVAGLRRITAPHGRLLINYSFYADYQQKAIVLMERLKAKYAAVTNYVYRSNIFIFATG